ncbi:hypothetical protein KIP88_02850 [Bradyrhizobium sp. SRL28]|uniref:hypothetical protein n=1 Tax=Bradyrhizobium sp. SRL28 TaxID=2836178 RepID=UPI001BDE8F2A|nr:hypothetical protein [Bradyrhizobium sp. SRL28]MBT1509430.1 hypothetical protein [Bradyrhizobium sp. SRL28]
MIILIGLFILLVLLFWCCRRAPAYYPQRWDSDCDVYCDPDLIEGDACSYDDCDDGGESDD